MSATAPAELSLKIGTLVENPIQMGWGPGRIVGTKGRNVWVVFRDHAGAEAKLMIPEALRPAASQNDPILDNLPEPNLVKGRPVMAGDRAPFGDAVRAFLTRYPAGFHDPAYVKGSKGGERGARWTAHENVQGALGEGELRRLIEGGRRKEACSRIRGLVGIPTMLTPAERKGFADALKDAAAAEAMLHALADVMESDKPNEESYGPFLAAVADLAHTTEIELVASWSVATLLPALARPDTHVFLKPAAVQKAARVLTFDLSYSPTLNWVTYDRALALSSVYRQKLEELGRPDLVPRDQIDVQAFIASAAESGGSRGGSKAGRPKAAKKGAGLFG